ncbi:MAG: TfoX/Sxy family protein [Candidatus Zixiibacteriota bacterium]|nr:MAG: TfoX/Sxy family protein [candidate division Zixibacteria bacterium]
MSISDEYLQYVRERLEPLGQITIRKMFGGAGVYCDGVFFAVIDSNMLYFKVDDSNRPDYEESGAMPFRPYGDEGYAMSYYEVPADVLEDNDLLRSWANKAISIARNKPAKNDKGKLTGK